MNRLNSIGDKLHPCFTPCAMKRGFVAPSPTAYTTESPLLVSEMNHSVLTNRIYYRGLLDCPCRMLLLGRLTPFHPASRLSILALSIAADTTSTASDDVLYLFRKPNCLSLKKLFSSTISSRGMFNSLVSIFIVTLDNVIGRVAPDTELTGYPAIFFCRIFGIRPNS